MEENRSLTVVFKVGHRSNTDGALKHLLIVMLNNMCRDEATIWLQVNKFTPNDKAKILHGKWTWDVLPNEMELREKFTWMHFGGSPSILTQSSANVQWKDWHLYPTPPPFINRINFTPTQIYTSDFWLSSYLSELRFNEQPEAELSPQQNTFLKSPTKRRQDGILHNILYICLERNKKGSPIPKWRYAAHQWNYASLPKFCNKYRQWKLYKISVALQISGSNVMKYDVYQV